MAIKELFEADNEIRIIGTRHGEKLCETLLTKEEYIAAKDLGNYFRVPADQRDLNYDKYFVERKVINKWRIHITQHRKTWGWADQRKLLKLDYIQNEFKEWKK